MRIHRLIRRCCRVGKSTPGRAESARNDLFESQATHARPPCRSLHPSNGDPAMCLVKQAPDAGDAESLRDRELGPMPDVAQHK